MAAELEGAGELVTGALLGRAVERHGGEGSPGALCLNCGTALIGAHCHRCGQSGHVHRSLGAIGHEILHGVAHFEGKLWRTLPALAWRPGELTRRYVEGERARFVSPMALFLFSVFAMFAVFSWVGLTPPADLHVGKPEAVLEQTRKDLIERRADAVQSLQTLSPGDPKRAKYDERIADAEQGLAGVEAALKDLRRPGSKLTVDNRKTGWAALDHGIEKWNKNPSLMLYKLQSSSYKFSWLLIPLSLPFVWLLFAWRREYRLYDHTVFITYSIAFMSLLFIALTAASAAGMGSGLVVTAGLLIPFVHIMRQLKQAYALGWFSAFVRAVILSFFILIIALLFLFLLLAMGMMG